MNENFIIQETNINPHYYDKYVEQKEYFELLNERGYLFFENKKAKI